MKTEKRQQNGEWGELFVALTFFVGPILTVVGAVLMLGLLVMSGVKG